MKIEHGNLMLTEQARGGHFNLPIDIFFRSLADYSKENAIAIILSGTGSDGSGGIVEISAEGGLVITQNLKTAKFDGMPKSALATMVVNKVLAPNRMPEFIIQYIENPKLPKFTSESPLDYQPTGVYGEIFGVLFKKHKIDFSDYKESTIFRRIDRRVKTLLLNSLEEYTNRLKSDESEVDSLLSELLIGVTSFFRDVDAFKIIEENIIPLIFKNNSGERQIRVWIPSCSTGEEAYSFAILLREYASRLKYAYDIKVFASDVNRDFLSRASSGRFLESQVKGLKLEFLNQYFRKEGDHFVALNDIRNMIIFAPQNLLIDPPFTQVDFISCRNFLIYIRPDQQQRVISSFHFALKKGGFLFLGPSEGLGGLAHEFSVQDSTWKVFKKTSDGKYPFSATTNFMQKIQAPAAIEKLKEPVRNVTQNIYDAIVKSLYTEFIIIDHDEMVIHNQSAKRYLDLQNGQFSLSLVKMIHPDIRSATMAALYRSQSESGEVKFSNITFEGFSLTIGVCPVLASDLNLETLGHIIYFVVSDSDVDSELGSAEGPNISSYQMDESSRCLVQDLEYQLQTTRESLQTSLEEAETTNEELQSTNEELLASNEELQSTNEELHSVNEELYTVNSEYQEKILELTQLEGDIDNLLHSTQIGTVFLDKQLNIRKYTPAINTQFGIMPQDIGRSIDAFLYKFEHKNLLNSLHEVLTNGRTVILEPKYYSNAWYSLKLLPYIQKEKICGVVLTFIDIDIVKKAQDEVAAKDKKLAIAFNDLDELSSLAAYDLKTLVNSARSVITDAKKQLFEPGSDLRDSFDKLGRIISSVDSMATGLISFSGIGKESSSLAPVSLFAMVKSISQKIVNNSSFEVMFDISEDLPTVVCDASKIERVFNEIFKNSLNYRTEKSKLKIEISHIMSDDNKAVISIRDNGKGIPENEIHSIFKIFRKVTDANDIERRNGMGLSLCRRILTQHSGQIWADSAIGFGTTINFSIPIKLRS